MKGEYIMKNKKPVCYIICESSISEYGITKITPLGVYLDHSQAVQELNKLKKQQKAWQEKIHAEIAPILATATSLKAANKKLAKITNNKFKDLQSYINFDGYSLRVSTFHPIEHQENTKSNITNDACTHEK